MKILIVEDSKNDRELMKYLLESRFQQTAKFREADNLKTAFDYLERGDIDCVILDLQLPDSVGKETFEKLVKRFPDVPVVVMTHNKDRELALDMIQKGAQEFVIKNFTDEEELFRRVLFAIEKHRQTVRVPTEEAASVHRLDKAKARLLTAHESGEHKAIKETTYETTTAMVELTRKMFTEMQKMNSASSKQDTTLDSIKGMTQKLYTEVLEGHPNQPSLKAQISLLDSRVTDLEEDIQKDRHTNLEIIKVTTTNRTKIIVAIIGLVGIVVGASIGAYHAIKNKTSTVEQSE